MSRERKLPPYSDDDIAADPDLAAALLRDAESLLAIEQQMKALREQKAELFDDLRASRFKPEFAKAWVATQMVDEEKDAIRAEKEIVLARVVSAMDAAKGAKSARARAGARNTDRPAQRQAEKFDAETGEIEPAASTEPMVSLDGKGAIPLDKFMTIAKAAETPVGRGIIAGFVAATNAKTAEPYRILARTDAPKPPVEDLDLPAGLRREPVVRSAEG